MENAKHSHVLKRDLDRGALSQSYLLLSPDGVHLMQIARWLATHFNPADVFYLTPKEGEKSIQVDQTLEWTGRVNLGAVGGRVAGEKKLFIITDVSVMTIPAQNKILKTLEDPRCDTVFLLLSTDEARVLPTIQSRCIKVSVPPLKTSLTEEAQISSNPNSPAIFASAKALLNCKTLDLALPHLSVLTDKDNLPLAFIALGRELQNALTTKSMPTERAYRLLTTLSDINRNILANANPTNAFDLFVIELIR